MLTTEQTENKTSIKFYKLHPDGTKTLVNEIPNKVKRSKYIMDKEGKG